MRNTISRNVLAASQEANANLQRLMFSTLVTFGILAILCTRSFAQSTASAAKVAKPTPCATTISKCGCAITKKGIYTVSADLSSSDGLTPDNRCIEIQTSNVILNLGSHKVTGPGGVNTDVGIDVKHGANNDALVGDAVTPALVMAWGTGVHVGGNNELFSNIHADSNDSFGFELDGSSNDRLVDWEANSPEGTFGLWIRSGNNNLVTKGTANTNGEAGIFVGCADAASTAGEDCKGAGKSTGNDVIDNTVDTNIHYGVALDSNAAQTLVNGNSGSGNGVHDLFDDSPSCGSNTWLDDSGTKSDLCVE